MGRVYCIEADFATLNQRTGVHQNFGSLFFAANNADFHELTKKNLRKLAEFAAEVLEVFKN